MNDFIQAVGYRLHKTDQTLEGVRALLSEGRVTLDQARPVLTALETKYQELLEQVLEERKVAAK